MDFHWKTLYGRLIHHEEEIKVDKKQLGDQLNTIAYQTPQEALNALNSSMEGLSEISADEKFLADGPNEVRKEQEMHWSFDLLLRFKSPINLLLLCLSLGSYLTGDPDSAIIILLMVVLSVGLSFVQEKRSSNAAKALATMVKITTNVLRRNANGNVVEKEIPLREVVVGDIIKLAAGDIVPADARVLKSTDLFVNQSALTGEAMPVEKHVDNKSEDGSVLELTNILFMGSNVVSGSAMALIVSTGADTFFGDVAKKASSHRSETAFDLGVSKFAMLMIKFMFFMAPTVFILNGLSSGNWLDSLMFGFSVAVGLAPELLPMIVTLNLAKGALRMSKEKVIVKRLGAIQNFGAIDILCTDKTGTLTQDKVVLQRHLSVDGRESGRVLRMAFLNSYYQTGLRNLLDEAVINHDQNQADHALKKYEKVDEIPFDFERKCMSVIVKNKETNENLLICKGAVEEVYANCTHYRVTDEDIRELTDAEKARLIQTARDMNADGLRVVAVAYKPTQLHEFAKSDESDMILAGYVAFLDPPKESAAKAIAALHSVGITVKVLTGDNDIVTKKVAKEVGLDVDDILIGSQIAKMSDEELADAALKVSVFAKLSPDQKARIVKALQSRGHAVGFMGDGINDATALKTADVGISVDTAVDIAKESADVILLEKDLMVLERGVLEGRKVFGNILKYIKMGASSNFGNMFSVIGASAFLPFVPMAPVQVLTNNLMYDFSQTGIVTDNVDDDYVKKPHKWDMGNIAKFMMYIGPLSSIFDYMTFGVLIFMFDGLHNQALFNTTWFVESCLSQTLVVHIIRTTKTPFLKSNASPLLYMTTFVICLLAVWLPYSTFADDFNMIPLPFDLLYYVFGIVALYLILVQSVKSWFVRKIDWI